jgi:hypothetical protein
MPSLGIRLTFSNSRDLYLQDVSALLYDLGLLHDLALIVLDSRYRDYTFTRYFWSRRGRPIRRDQQIAVAAIRHGSPLTIDAVVSMAVLSSGAIWVLVQAFERIANWKLNRKRLELEISNLQIDNDIRVLQERQSQAALERTMSERDAWVTMNRLMKRLEANPLNLNDMEIRSVPDRLGD